MEMKQILFYFVKLFLLLSRSLSHLREILFSCALYLRPFAFECTINFYLCFSIRRSSTINKFYNFILEILPDRLSKRPNTRHRLSVFVFVFTDRNTTKYEIWTKTKVRLKARQNVTGIVKCNGHNFFDLNTTV